MRLFKILTIATSIILSAVNADLESLAALYPECGFNCTVAGISQSSCSATDQLCICTNKELIATVSACVETTCTIREQLSTKNLSSVACGAPVRDKTLLVSGLGAGGGALALIVFVIRIYAKFTVPAAQLGYDDLNISISMVLLVVFSILSVEIAESGFGRDIWTVPFDNVTKILKIYFIDELLYITIVSTTKIAILCFYLRVFPQERFRVAVLCTMAATVAYMIAFILVSAFQCWPVSYAWTHWDGEHKGRCNNVNAQGWAAAAINIALDFVILILPLRLIYKLSLHWKKKLQISIMLSVGGFVTIVSIVRLETLYQFARSKNVSWDGVPFGYWSCIEMDVGVICACMPALYSLFKHHFPQVFSGTLRSKSSVKGILSTGNSGPLPAETPSYRRNDDRKDFLPLVDLENVKDDRPGIAI